MGLLTTEIMRRLKVRFSPPAWAFVQQVSDSTGGARTRTADAIAMSIWPSRGLELNGFEVKASRGDWKKELANPAKAEPLFRYCDRWWIVAGDDDIVQAGELPGNWGLLIPHGTGLTAITPAPKLTPAPITREFLAALLRKSCEQSVDAETISATYQEAFKKGEAAGLSSSNRLRREVDELQKVIADFEQASGVELDRWSSGKKIGEAVKLILAGTRPIQRFKNLHKELGRVLEEHSQLTDLANAPDEPTIIGE